MRWVDAAPCLLCCRSNLCFVLAPLRCVRSLFVYVFCVQTCGGGGGGGNVPICPSSAYDRRSTIDDLPKSKHHFLVRRICESCESCEMH